MLCLPNDAFIFYKHPLGAIGEYTATKHSLPTNLMIHFQTQAQCSPWSWASSRSSFSSLTPPFPREKQSSPPEVRTSQPVANINISISQYHYPNTNISTPGGKLMLVLRNSWSQHLSVTYNEKYEYVLRVTWVGYQFFGTLALAIYLIQVSLLAKRQGHCVLVVRTGLARSTTSHWPFSCWKVSPSSFFWVSPWSTGMPPSDAKPWTCSGRMTLQNCRGLKIGDRQKPAP